MMFDLGGEAMKEPEDKDLEDEDELVYSDDEREELVENDEISSWEAAFIKGWKEAMKVN
ncbi:MAG: hypothetical protein Q7J54_06340 [Candidatus Woesearchaeota archaeon]|nr:hypothetical protein [Candidatus Woesearchaeota archaeon]